MLPESTQESEKKLKSGWKSRLWNGFQNLWFPGSPVGAPADQERHLAVMTLQQALAQRAGALPRLVWRTGLLLVCALGIMEVSPFFFLPLYLLGINIAHLISLLFSSDSTIRETVKGLIETDDLRAIGPLTEILPLWEHASSPIIYTLYRLLPQVKAADGDLLNEKQRGVLRRILARSTNRLFFWSHDPVFAELIYRTLVTIGELPPNVESATASHQAGISPMDTTLGEALQNTQQANTDTSGPSAWPLEGMLQPFQEAVRQRRKNTTTMTVTAAISALTALGNLYLQLHPGYNSQLLLAALGALGLTFLLSFRGLWKLRGLMNALANVQDLRIAGPLLEIAAVEDGSARGLAMQILRHLLPRFRASDARLLTDNQHTMLLRALTRQDAALEFVLAALKALEQIGDLRALPVVESLATGRRVTADPKRVQSAAQECLPYLLIRCEQQRASQTLLRASSSSSTPAADLLRPAHGTGDTSSTELLRAGLSPPENRS